jgi:hypothetical protein
MTLEELCKKSNLSAGRAEAWIESGLIMPVAGRRREFDLSQVQRVHLIKELQRKGVELAQLAGRDLSFRDEKFVVFDGHELRACANAETAIAAAARVKRCAIVDLGAIRRASA